ncbi:glycogen-binding domain-containing protein [Psychroserpens jangbogonensis]|uniref:glycogen-binding domain-containing protein n=1 Tax=Psychroserpens jangbogonensis TaxID=1484460 RepID=UPI00053E914B|nr:glycogen-binding domain-containing protein [Psychroserpens jangbogonensis]
MTIKSLYTIILLFVITIHSSFAQNQKGYTIENEDVVFTFHRSDYETLSHDKAGNRINFDDLTVENVVVSGEFNNWSKYDWKMTKIDEDTYQLRKPVSKFEGEFTWEFKFIINNEYWAEPNKNTPNAVDAKDLNGENLHVYNLKMYPKAYPDDNGNVRFRLRGHDDVQNVIVAGSFNKWNEHLFRMYKIENGWELKVQMKPGEYDYRFIVDGQWMEDPSNPDKVKNEFSEFNSRINVGKYATFLLKGYEEANSVVLSGSFNDWNESDLQMTKTDNGYWKYRLPLPAGKHHYKFIIDGNWILDPNNSVKEYDDEGNVNSVFMVR